MENFNNKWTGISLLIFWIFLLFFFSSCSQSYDFFQKELLRYGYLPYVTPLKESGPGTLIGGSPQQMLLVAGSESCFPKFVGDEPTNLYLKDETTLTQKDYHFSVSGKNKFNILKVLNVGTPSIRAGVDFNKVGSMELDMQGVHIEYMDSLKLTEFYQKQMSQICKDYFEHVGFIIQAIKVDKMIFQLKRDSGASINLALEGIKNFIDFDTSIKWKIESGSKLIIETPKYIGYQLGSLRKQDQGNVEGMILYRATSVKKNKYQFKPISVFSEEGSGDGDDNNVIIETSEDQFFFSPEESSLAGNARYFLLR
jgi:hypothetical protein